MRGVDTFIQDVRYGCRLIGRTPMLSAAIVLTLAVGVGLDTGVFTVINGILFRARVAKDPESFVQIAAQYSGTAAPRSALPAVTARDYQAYRDSARSVSDLAAWSVVHAAFGGEGGDAAVDVIPLLVTCNFFQAYGAEPPLLGRLFRPDECVAPGAAPVVVIGEDLWRSRLAADPQIVGRSITLNRRPFTVVGVMRSGYAGQLRGPLWIPYTMQTAFYAGVDLFSDATMPWLVMVGRLAPGATRAGAFAEFAVLSRQQDRLVPGRETTLQMTNGSRVSQPMMRTTAVWLVPLVMGALSLVVLLACANVTMLLLSRASARQHEMAVRLALGADRRRLVRMLLTESLILACIGAPLAAYLASLVPIAVRRLIPRMPYYPFTIDGTIFMYLALVTMGAGILAGVAPALESLKRDISFSLQGNRNRRTRDLLVSAQVAMSLVLLAGAALFVRAEYRLAAADQGYDSDRVLMVAPRVQMPPHTPASAATYYRALAERVSAIPGVQAVAYASAPPFDADENRGGASRVRRRGDAEEAGIEASVNAVSPEYFATLGIPLTRGRVFQSSEGANQVPPVIASESLARALWPARDPIGELLETTSGQPAQVVGIARNIRSLGGGSAGTSTLYRLRDRPAAGGALMIRFDGDAAPVARDTRAAMAALDADTLAEPRTLTAMREEAAIRFLALVKMLLFLAGVALLLAIIGIYGVVAFAVTRRMKEMGIRIALGATGADIVRLVLSSATRPLMAGLAAGLGIALVASQALRQLFKSAPIPLDVRDPVAYLGVAALLTLVALCAMLPPAWRAASSDPVHALRED